MITDIKQEILLVAEPGREEEAIIRLSRVGYDHTIGYLTGGFSTWLDAGKEVDQVERLSAEEVANMYANQPIIIDVRKKSEFDSEHIVNAINIPLNEINKHFSSFPTTENFIVHCAGGYRSMIAASILKSRGYHNFKDVVGGMTDLLKTDMPKTEYVCPSTLL
jgi:rhodanese-related sulfurtransferase